MEYTEEYRTIDRTDWPSGPWDNEPDKAVWIDEATGLPCMLKRREGAGFLCGYVGVPEGHPYHGKHYHEIDADLDVHGGLSYTDACEEGEPPETGICHIGSDQVWWFGFDCAHWNDTFPAPFHGLLEHGTYKDVPFVQSECHRLALQLTI